MPLFIGKSCPVRMTGVAVIAVAAMSADLPRES
jgi:hypothetical protein